MLFPARPSEPFGLQISKRSMPDVQNPHRLVRIVHFVKNSIRMLPVAKEKAPDFTPHVRSLTSKGTPVWKLFERIESVNKLLEPHWPSRRGTLDDPVVNLIGVGLSGLRENGLVAHVLSGTLFQTAAAA